jgi:HSP20 family protein
MALPVVRRRESEPVEVQRPSRRVWSEPLAHVDDIFDDLFARMNQLLRSFRTDPLNGWPRPLASSWTEWPSVWPDWSPPTDVEETDDAYVVEIELPGVSRKDLNLELTGRRLRLHGEVKQRERNGFLRWQTRRLGRFDYTITLPGAIDGDNIKADLANGILTVRVPKAEHERPRRIEIAAGPSD